jgi:hypothetical protein
MPTPNTTELDQELIQDPASFAESKQEPTPSKNPIQSESPSPELEPLKAISTLIPDSQEPQPPIESYANLRQEALEAVAQMQQGVVTPQNLTTVLRAWKYSFEQKEEIVPLDEDKYQQRQQWATEVAPLARTLQMVLSEEPNHFGIKPGQHLENIRAMSYELSTESKGLLAEYISQRIVNAQEIFEQTKPRQGLPPRPVHQEAQLALEETIDGVQPMLLELMSTLSSENSATPNIRRVFEYLQAAEQQELANNLLLVENITDEQRLSLAVQYINVYGFIPTINLIAPIANDRDDLKCLYSRLQGDTVTEVMEDLWMVYKRYEQKADFADYYQDEITKTELALLESLSEDVCKTFDKSRGELNVVSLAAGKGRMAFALESAGFKVVAVEPQAEYVKAIEASAEGKNITVVPKTWDELTIGDLQFPVTPKDLEAIDITQDYLSAFPSREQALESIQFREYAGVEFGESTGRSLPHGNSPQYLLNALDSIRSVSKDGAIWVVDFMDPFSGRYKENIEKLRGNLLSLGVDPTQSHFTFEGPEPGLRFNRMTVSQEQMHAYAELLGFKVKEVIETPVGEDAESFKNVYYVLEVAKDFYPGKYTRERLIELLAITGLSDPGTDLNERVKSFGLSLGQALVYGFPSTPDYLSALPATVKFSRRGNKIDVTGRSVGRPTGLAA